MKKTLLQLLLVTSLISLVAFHPGSVAQAATNEDESASNSATTEELRKRIEKVVDEKREQIKGVLEDLLAKKTGFIGEITRISEEAITVKSADNTTIIPIADSLTILEKNKPIKVSAVEVGNWAVVLGNKDGQGIESEYILVSDETLRPKNQLVVLGSITALTRTELTIATRSTQEERKLSILKTSQFQDVNGEAATATDFEKDLNVLVIGLEGEDGWELQTVRSLAAFEEDE